MSKAGKASTHKIDSSAHPQLIRLGLLAALVFAIFQLGRWFEDGSLDDTMEAMEDFVVAQREALSELGQSLF